MMLFGQGLFDFGLSEGVLHIVRIIASVGGAVVGWFVCDPLTRLLYRVSFRGATPGSLLLGTKLGGAVTLSLLIYFFMPLGGGGGFGFGPGPGGLPGKGHGEGGSASNGIPKTRKDAKDKKDAKTTEAPNSSEHVETVEIEILGGDRVQNKRYYLIKGSAAPFTDDELKRYFEKNHGKIKVIPVLTDESVGLDRDNNPLIKLKKLADDCKIERLPLKTPSP